MRGETIARNYAEALFDLGDRHGEVDSYGAALDDIATILSDAPGVRAFLETPRIKREEKKRVLTEAFGGRVPQHVLNFLLLVLDKRRQGLLREIATGYGELLDERMGRAHVEVHVAREMDEDEMGRVKDRLTAILGKEAIPHVEVRPELIGGIAFRSGDTIFDGSVRRRLQRMRRSLMATDLSTD